jgi:hypothetical protein
MKKISFTSKLKKIKNRYKNDQNLAIVLEVL